MDYINFILKAATRMFRKSESIINDNLSHTYKHVQKRVFEFISEIA